VEKLAAPQLRGFLPTLEAHRILERVRVELDLVGIDEYRFAVGDERVTNHGTQFRECLSQRLLRVILVAVIPEERRKFCASHRFGRASQKTCQ
jgi:hypothetical protein